MKFHIAAAVLFGGIIFLIYLLLHGLEADLSQARGKIEKESFQSAKKQKALAKDNQTSLDSSFLNKEISEEPTPMTKPVPLPVEAKKVEKTPPLEERLEGKEYWCRPIPVVKDRNPVRCEYPDSCYSCKNSDIIPPEVDSAIPFCRDGSRAEIYSVECCPSSVSGNDFSCPSIDECMRAENVPEQFCSCDGRANCRYVAIGKEIECACIQE